MGQTDWLPSTKTAMVEMACNWGSKLAVHGQVWSVPDAAVQSLAAKTAALQTLIAVPASGRTPTMNAQIKTAQKELAEAMRDIKKRYFYVPPLAEADIVSLGLKPKDTTQTVVNAPKLPMDGDLYYPAAGLVEIRNIRIVGDNADARVDYGVRIYYGILDVQGAGARLTIPAPPKTGEDLPHSVFTRQKKFSFDFSGHNGKEIFFCMRGENSKGQAGPWGNMLKTYIP